MTTALVSPDGNMTLPAPIAAALGLEHGGRVEFVQLADGQVTMIARTLPAQVLRGILPKPDVRCSAEEMVTTAARRAAMAAK